MTTREDALMADTSFIDQVIDFAVEAVEERPLNEVKREVWPLTPPEPAAFIGPDDETIEYQPAPNLARRAAQLIEDYPELAHVQGLEVRFLWRGSGGTSAGKRVLGKCSKISGAARYFSAEETGVPADVLIWLAADHLQHATDRGIEAVLYHELCFPAGVSVTGPRVDSSSVRWYAGKMVEIRTASGHFLAGTPNHPILTDRGWVPLGFLHVGDHVVSSGRPERVALAVDPDEYQVPATIEQVARSGLVPLRLVPPAAKNLNAHVPDREVDVVLADRELWNRVEAAGLKHMHHLDLVAGNARPALLPRQRRLRQRFVGMPLTAPIANHGFSMGGPLFRRHPLHSQRLCSRVGADRYAGINQHATDDIHADRPFGGETDLRFAAEIIADDAFGVDVRARVVHRLPAVAVAGGAYRDIGVPEDSTDWSIAGADRLRDRLERLPGEVALDNIVSVEVRPFRGHVYNLQTSEGWYLANGIIAHNCHIGWDDEKDKLVINAHDVEGFVREIERYGLHTGDLRRTEQAMRQLRLGETGGA